MSVTTPEMALGAALGFGAIAAAGVVSAGLFAGLETGMYTMSHVRLSVRAARGDEDSARLAREYARPKRLLSTLLVANAIAGWVASFGVSQIFDGLGYGPVQAVLLDLLVLLPIVFLFGEVLPKDLFRVHADRWMPRYATLLMTLRILLCATGIVPLVAGIGTLASRILRRGGSAELLEARARVSALLAEGAGSGGLSEVQLGFADRVFTMREIAVGHEMRVWREVAWVSIAASPAERARVFLQSGASRLPVVDATGRVSGVAVAVDHFASPDAATSALVRPIVTLAPGTSALEAIQTMRRARAQLALVAERPDRPLGIVSMKDLVEPLVGDLAAW
jgi:putative hemolysin